MKMNKKEMIELLHREVIAALGCTEPACIALCAADAFNAIGGSLLKIKVLVSNNMCKNAMSVGIPGFDRVGITYSAALGAFIENPDLALRIFHGITPRIAQDAIKFVDDGHVTMSVSDTERGVFVRCEVVTDRGTGISVIKGAHTNIILTQANDEILKQADEKSESSTQTSLTDKLKAMKVSEMLKLVQTANEDELDFLYDGVEMNRKLSNYGMTQYPGIGITKVLNSNRGGALMGDGLWEKIMVEVVAATEARLEGCPLAAMSSAGSGSKGIATILPVVDVAETLKVNRKTMLQALAFAHLLNDYINVMVGKLTSMCTCSIGSATAASASITWLMGGTDEQIAFAIRNMTGDITGLICDGGKTGCALKLSTSMTAALTCALLAINNVGLRPTDGVCAVTPEDCIRNISRIGNTGMSNADHEILNIMLEKEKNSTKTM